MTLGIKESKSLASSPASPCVSRQHSPALACACAPQIADIPLSADHIRYFAGWADKVHGKTIPCDNVFGEL